MQSNYRQNSFGFHSYAENIYSALLLGLLVAFQFPHSISFLAVRAVGLRGPTWPEAQ